MYYLYHIYYKLCRLINIKYCLGISPTLVKRRNRCTLKIKTTVPNRGIAVFREIFIIYLTITSLSLKIYCFLKTSFYFIFHLLILI